MPPNIGENAIHSCIIRRALLTGRCSSLWLANPGAKNSIDVIPTRYPIYWLQFRPKVEVITWAIEHVTGFFDH
jgi:hypothetical protein